MAHGLTAQTRVLTTQPMARKPPVLIDPTVDVIRGLHAYIAEQRDRRAQLRKHSASITQKSPAMKAACAKVVDAANRGRRLLLLGEKPARVTTLASSCTNCAFRIRESWPSKCGSCRKRALKEGGHPRTQLDLHVEQRRPRHPGPVRCQRQQTMASPGSSPPRWRSAERLSGHGPFSAVLEHAQGLAAGPGGGGAEVGQKGPVAEGRVVGLVEGHVGAAGP